MNKRMIAQIPSFMSSKEIDCPRCVRIEWANVDPERMVMCSFCLMQRVFVAERQGKEAEGIVRTWRVRPRPIPFREKRLARKCERCGELFRGQSNRKRFCKLCHKGSRDEYQRKLMSDRRKKESLVSI